MKQQTAVEWVVLQMLDNDFRKIWPSLLERAKEMEKIQIMQAYNDGKSAVIQILNNKSLEQYYNDTYNKL